MSVLEPILFNIFVNHLDDGGERTLRKLADDTKLGRMADMPDGHAPILRDLHRLEKQADRNFMKFTS